MTCGHCGCLGLNETLLGKPIGCVNGVRYVGLDVSTLEKRFTESQTETESEKKIPATLVGMYKSLVDMDPKTLCDVGGFSVALQPNQILLAPPAMVIAEVSLNQSNLITWWSWLVPSHLGSSSQLSEKAGSNWQQSAMTG